MVKTIVKSTLLEAGVLTEEGDEARELYNQSRFGAIQGKKVNLSLFDALFLLQKGRITIHGKSGRRMNETQFLRKARKMTANFDTRYAVFADLRKRGYIVKTALKFGADFRVYDRGIKPGEDHARWVVYPVAETSSLTWHEFAAKNRVAHSTKKRLLIGVVDDEGDVSYWEIKWLRP
ncbi:MAG: tRNA-intron lyase [DPANN group archaeon]|nr:tRNA-intron lyase [DPANN group archaeon]